MVGVCAICDFDTEFSIDIYTFTYFRLRHGPETKSSFGGTAFRTFSPRTIPLRALGAWTYKTCSSSQMTRFSKPGSRTLSPIRRLCLGIPSTWSGRTRATTRACGKYCWTSSLFGSRCIRSSRRTSSLHPSLRADPAISGLFGLSFNLKKTQSNAAELFCP